MTCEVPGDDNRFLAVDEFLPRRVGKPYIHTELRQDGNLRSVISLLASVMVLEL
jgi:hypothetical protein